MWSQFNGEHACAAMRRRQRRLRQWLRHERLSVAMALAESQHHAAPRGQSMARAGGWVRDEVHGRVPFEPTPQEPGTQHFFLDDDSVPELGGSRPDRLVDVRPQERVPRRIVEQLVDTVPVVQLLHVPVQQMVDSVVEVLKILDKSLPDVEQVIEVPKILQHTVLQRSSSLQEPQMVDQVGGLCRPIRTPCCVSSRVLLCRFWRTSWWKCRRSCLSIVPRSFFAGDGWVRVAAAFVGLRGPTGGECGSSHTQWAPPPWIHRQARAV